jgi:hypothetical protein
MYKVRQPHWNKVPWQIVEFMQLNTLVTMYNNHLAIYNIGKKTFYSIYPKRRVEMCLPKLFQCVPWGFIC